MESIPCSDHHALCMYHDPVYNCRFCQQKNPLSLIKNQVPGYTTALGTQSSAATIPVNLNVQRMTVSVLRSVTL